MWLEQPQQAMLHPRLSDQQVYYLLLCEFYFMFDDIIMLTITNNDP